MKKRRTMPKLAGGLTAAVALLAGLSLAQAQAPAPAPPLSGAGSFPQSFIVPGTNTSLHVGGQVQVDMSFGMDTYSNASSSPGAYDNLAPGGVGIEGPGAPGTRPHTNHGDFRLTANNSRPFFETRTPTAYGEMKTYIEFDFAGGQSTVGPGSGGSTATKCCADDGIPRVRQAYGTLGPWLFGKANSNFADLAALADTLDSFVQAGGFMGAGTVRQTQIRYTWLLPMGISAAASVENSASGGIIGTDATGHGATNITANDFNAPGLSQHLPAVNGRVQMQQPWGHVSLALGIMQERLQNDGPGGSLLTTNALPGGAHLKRWGYQMAFSGHYNTFGKDKATWSIGYGQGAAQYSWALNELGAQWEEGLVCNLLPGNGLQCSQPRVFGVNAGYSHFWTDEWRTGVSFGYDDVSRPNSAAGWTNATAGVVTGNASLAKIEHRHYSAGISTFWTPVDAVQFGIGYLWYHREVWSGAKGSANRLLSQAVFRF